jgi:hypothetical protein
MHCPNCGFYIPPPPTGEWAQLKTFHTTALALPGQNGQTQEQPAFSEAYRKTPYRKPELIPDVWVPLTQAIISGLLSALVATIISLFVASWPLYIGLIIGPLVVGLVWLYSMLNDRGLWIVERITGQDVEQDDKNDHSTKRIVEIEVKEGRNTRIAELPGEGSYLIRFCQWVAAGDSFSEETAAQCGYGVTNFRKLRDKFVSQRWGFWRNANHPRQGVELTVHGKQIIRRLANTPPPLSVEIPNDSFTR